MGGELEGVPGRRRSRALHAHRLTLSDVTDALARANVNVGGGYIERKSESLTLRGVGRARATRTRSPTSCCAPTPTGRPCWSATSPTVRVGAALRYGVITRDGEGEAVTGIVMMLIGANSRDVVTA